MEEEFVLPEYWYLKITDENREYVKRWRKEVFNNNNSIDNFSYINSLGAGCLGGVWGRVLLNTSQFIEYVYNPLFLTQQSIKQDYSYLIPFIQKLEIL